MSKNMIMGSPEGEGVFDEHPQHIVYLDDYYIDKYEVKKVQFKEFVEATGYVRCVFCTHATVSRMIMMRWL